MAKDKGVVVSFRVDRHLADILNKVPDKSSFIREAILRSFYQACPVCLGRGFVPEEISRWATKQQKADKAVECTCCLYPYPRSTIPADSLPKTSRDRFVCPHCMVHDHAH
jgi:hypothetical protein